MLVLVKEGIGGLDRALKALKRKLQAEGVLRELRDRRNYTKPSERRRKALAQSIKRRRKFERKKLQRELGIIAKPDQPGTKRKRTAPISWPREAGRS